MPVLKTILSIGMALAIGMFLFCYLFLLKNIRLPRMALWEAPDQYGLVYEPVSLTTKDGLRLAGWWIPSAPDRPTVVMVHGLGTNRSDLLSMAAVLSQAKFNLLMFDLRAHGESEGEMTSYGWLEQQDVKAALDFLDRHATLKNRSYGVYAVSMGAATAILTASGDSRIRSIVADSAFADLAEVMDRHLKLLWGFPPSIFGWFAHRAYELRFLTSIQAVSPKRAIPRLSPRPILLIAGGQDQRMPPQDVQALFKQAGDPKELWVVPEAEHTGAFYTAPDEYARRVTAFFEKSL